MKLIDLKSNNIINSNKIFYFKNEKKIFSKGETFVNLNNEYDIKSKNIFYYRDTMVIKSDEKSEIRDNLNNLLTLENFNFALSKKILRGNKVSLLDFDMNQYYFEDVMINFNSNKIIGKDITAEFNNKYFGDQRNQPRLKGNKFEKNYNNLTIGKGSFTTCKRRDGKCPPWVIYSEEIEHDKKKKTISYKNAWLKLYDKPVFYFPKFFHPDPTVKRQSGFLMPQINNSLNLNSSFDIPYFKAISDNKDLTATPRFYSDKKILLQTEYRQANKNSDHIIDASFVTRDSKSHFFSNSITNLGLSNFDTSKLEINIEQTSGDTYLKKYKLKSPLINDVSTLNSYVNFQSDTDDLIIEASAEVFENLDKIESDRYEYVYPSFNILKYLDFDNLSNGETYISTSGFQKTYNTNNYDAILINDLVYNSYSVTTDAGVKKDFSLLFKNVNTKSTKSMKYKDENEILSLIDYRTSYPLTKEKGERKSILEPIISLRYSPNKSKNMVSDDRRIDINNIFSINRIGVNDTVEGGESLTIGSKYSKYNNNDLFFNFDIATAYRNKLNEDLPTKSTLGEKSSDVVGKINFLPNDVVDFSYDFSLDNNLKTSNYNLINAKFNINNFVTSFDFMEENNALGNESYLANNTSYNFDDSSSIGFATRRNKKTNLTEFYNLIYQYKNDCLMAAIEYNKEYYKQANLEPEEQLFFSITIMPFGKTNSPNIN